MFAATPSKERRKMKTSNVISLLVIAALADELSGGSESAGHRYFPNVQATGWRRVL